MKTFSFIEDYIEIIAGTLCVTTGKRTPSFLTTSPLSLARYDVGVINSFAEQIENKIGLTDRQSELAIKIIKKYEKQLTRLGVDVSSMHLANFKFPIRQIDRSQRLYRDGSNLVCRFPFNEQLVQTFKKLIKDSQGSAYFDKDKKAWVLAITEYNVNWSFNFAQNNNFTIDSECYDLMKLILDVEKEPYEIKLVIDNNKLLITNAESSLLTYLENNVGDLTTEKLEILIDLAPILGYTIDTAIEELAIKKHSARLFNLLNSRICNLGSDNLSKNIDDILTFADLTNRWPIHFFEPNCSGQLLTLAQTKLGKDKVIDISKENVIPSECLAIYYSKYNSHWTQKVPLVVTTHGMMFGLDKQILVDRAEKIVYLTTDVYNTERVKSIAS